MLADAIAPSCFLYFLYFLLSHACLCLCTPGVGDLRKLGYSRLVARSGDCFGYTTWFQCLSWRIVLARPYNQAATLLSLGASLRSGNFWHLFFQGWHLLHYLVSIRSFNLLLSGTHRTTWCLLNHQTFFFFVDVLKEVRCEEENGFFCELWCVYWSYKFSATY